VPRKSAQQPLRARDLGRWRLLENFQERLARLAKEHGVAPTFADPRRRLELGHYLGMFLFGLLNPAVRTMRGLCAASDLGRMQREVCGAKVSLGSFSETQAVVDPALLKKVFGELAAELCPPPARGAKRAAASPAQRWLIVDSTLWELLPRRHWALWRQQGRSQSAARLHVSLHLLEDTPVPATVTGGRACERKVWRQNWQPGDAYVGDRYYGENYRLFHELDALECAFVLRLRESAALEIDEELPLREADRQARVVRQAWAHLGAKSRQRSPRVRLVWVQTGKEELILVTTQTPEALSAEMVAEL